MMELKIKNEFISKNLGVFFGILAATGNAVVQSLSKKLVQQSCTPNQVILYRYAVQISVAILLISFKGRKFTPEPSDRKYVFTKCAGMVIFNVFMYYSFLNMSYFDSMDLAYGTMIVTSIIVGRIWFLERMTVFSSIVTVFIFVGLVLCCQPTLIWKQVESQKMYGILIGSACSLAAGFIFGVNSCLNKKINDTSVKVLCFYNALFGILFSGVQAIIIWKNIPLPQSSEIIWLSIAVGLNSTGVCFFNFYAYQLSEVYKITLTYQIELPFAIALEWAIFGDVPNGLVLSGVGIMVICVVLMTLQDPILRLFRSDTYETV